MSQSVNHESGYLDLKALASYASCSVRFLRARLTDHSNPLPCYRIGGKVLVKRVEFDAWMSQYRHVPQPDELDQIVDGIVAAVGSPKRAA
jgi:hypothetical protein